MFGVPILHSLAFGVREKPSLQASPPSSLLVHVEQQEEASQPAAIGFYIGYWKKTSDKAVYLVFLFGSCVYLIANTNDC